jgi:hypothetical protein
VNQSAVGDTRLPDPHSELDVRLRDGKLYLTTSLLIRHEHLREALRQQAPDLQWDKELVAKLRKHEQSGELSRAIEPLFNDIADRKRGLFVEDFLIDTDSIDPAEGHGPNVCDIVDIEMPGRVRWSTEGYSLRVDLDEPVRFEHVLCRAFWVAHSNLSLSYHLSFELSYQHKASHYYALSLLQKMFFPTEGVAVATGPFAISLRDQQTSEPLGDHVRRRFQIDAVDLFATTLTAANATPEAASGAAPVGTSPVTKLAGAGLVNVLLGHQPDPPDDVVVEWDWKCVSVLEDPYFFGLLQHDGRSGLDKLDPVEPVTADGGILAYGNDVLDGCDPDHLAYYFLSGFFQNVIDFLRQDISEVQDGTDPIYPPPAIQDDSGYFIVYATPASLYEVVSQSRSLKAGRGWIGTCPYLFLVHLMTLHNEDLVRRYEQQVRGLIDHLEKVRLLGLGDRLGRWRHGWRSGETFDRFRRFRLSAFEEVQRHRYFNVLRYDTERAFYESIEEVRGIRQREQYWAGVVADLETTVDDLRDAQQRHDDRRRNDFLGAVTVIGVLQVAFDLLDYLFEKDVGQIGWAAGLTLVAILFASRMVRSARRSEK